MLNRGDTISRYRIIGPLGRGGMGEVYQAEDLRLLRPVALKFLPAGTIAEVDRQRLMQEARAAAVIRHPNICPIYDVEDADGQLFIAMAYLEGETLRTRLGRGPMPVESAVAVGIQLASALEQAHAQGIVHRDIKSGNVIVTAEGHAYLLDFGLALRPGQERLTEAGRTVGTPAYMAPEQIRGKELDGRADLWALGVLLYEMVTGRHPFARQQDLSMLHAILEEAPQEMGKLRPEAPPELAAIVAKALEKKPENRYASAREMGDALRRLAPERGMGLRETTETWTRARQVTETMVWGEVAKGAKPSWRWAVGVLVVVLAMAVVGGYWWRQRAGREGGAVEVGAGAALAARQVAVLPFTMIGGDEEARTTADGLMEVITAAMSEFQAAEGKFLVVPASEVRRRNIGSPEEAKRIYGANVVLRGAVQAMGPAGGRVGGKKLQLTLAAIDTGTLRQLRAGVVDYDSGDPIASRDRAVAEVARVLEVRAPAGRMSAVGDAGEGGTPAAYAPYLEGRGLLARYDVRGNLEKAAGRLEQATTIDPRFGLAWAALAEVYWRQSRAAGSKELAAKALECAEKAVRLEPNTAVTHSTLGAIYGTAGREAEAIAELRKAMALSPLNAQPPRELARIYAGSGRVAEAEQLYLQANAARPTDWYGHFLLGVLYYQREQYDKAEAVLRKALALAPGNDLVARQLGATFLQQGRYQEAIDELQASLKMRTNAVTYLTLGTAYYYQHRFREAVTTLETAIDLDANRYYYWGNLGAYYKWTPGEQGKAEVALRKAIELARKQLEVTPKDYDVRADLAEYLARVGDRAGALAEIAKVPEAEQQPRATRLALAYELTGNRARAIALIRSKLTNPASLTQIQDDPDLAGLWKDPNFQAAIPAISRRKP